VSRVYATAADYTTWVGADESDSTAVVPADIDRQLARASLDVERATLTAVYAVDGDGLPTDTTIAQAFEDATCAQVEAWQSTGDELGTGNVYDDVQIGSVRLARRGANAGAASQPGALAPRAATILSLAGLLSDGVLSAQPVVTTNQRVYG
jgi:hypothetical protein